MKVDIDQIPYKEIKPDSLMVIHFPESEAKYPEEFDRMIKGLQNSGMDRGVQVLILQGGATFDIVTEEAMAKAGWYRNGSAFINGKN